MEMEDLNGKRDTVYWTNKKQRLFESRFYSQPAALPAMKDSRYKPLQLLRQGPAGPNRDKVFRSCVLATRSVIEARPQESKSILKHDSGLDQKQSTEKNHAHKQCLEARDYEGCLRAKTSPAQNGTDDKCSPDGKYCTVTTKGVDDLACLSQWAGDM